MAQVLVTGASGFVGKHLVVHLRSSGDDVTTSCIDITDRNAIAAEFQHYHPEIIYHLAAQADIALSWKTPIETLRVNIEGTYNVLEAAHNSNVQRVLVTSSADVYGQVDPTQLPVSETAPVRPVTPYGASKAAAEILSLQAGFAQGTDIIRTRAFNHLGPGQNNRFVASSIAAQITANERSGAKIVRAGNLAARRDFTDVRDVVRAYRMLAVAGEPGEVYNICNGKSHTIQELAELLLKKASHDMHIEVDPTLMRPIDVPEVRGNPEKLQKTTGWEPEISLDTTLRDLLGYYRNQTPHSR